MKPARWLRPVLVASSSLSALLLVPAGLASANPIIDALANTTCNYGQITAAIDAESPAMAATLKARPDLQTLLQQFLALPVDQRQQRLAQQQAANPQMATIVAAQFGPQGQQAVLQVAGTCMNY
jgi:hemophore-related protein